MKPRTYKYGHKRVELAKDRFNNWSVRVYDYGNYNHKQSRHGIIGDETALKIYTEKIHCTKGD